MSKADAAPLRAVPRGRRRLRTRIIVIFTLLGFCLTALFAYSTTWLRTRVENQLLSDSLNRNIDAYAGAFQRDPQNVTFQFEGVKGWVYARDRFGRVPEDWRKLREGIHPELEMGRFLTDEVAFANCVPVLGALEYVSDNGQRMALALVQTQVANQGDGWAFTIDYLERHLEGLHAPMAAPQGGTDTHEIHGGFLLQMAMLGQRTAELHIALARSTGHAAFDPEPWTDEDLAAWRQHAHAELDDTLALLRMQGKRLAATVQPMAQALMDLAPSLHTRIDTIISAPAGCLKTRHHGDYHLGQVLVTGHDFVIIDFEGEPARDFSERRAKGLPLRDVAGMLRSFSYARWTALRRTIDAGQDDDQLAEAARQWEQVTRAAFLQAYAATRAADAGHVTLPDDLLALFELDKALYELRYEINNRADWVAVPLHGILELLHDGPAS